MFNHILVPMDGSSLAECVLPHVVAMARPLAAKVTLLHVCEPEWGEEAAKPTNAFAWRLKVAEADAYLEGVAGRLQGTGLDLKTQRLEGRAAEQIMTFAHQHAVDLILLSTHGRSGLTGWNVSSVVQKIIARARVSLMIVRAYQAPPGDLSGLKYGHLLCPLDCSQRAEHVLPIAAVLARGHGAQLLLAHVVARPEMPRRRPYTGEELELIDKVVELNQEEAIQCFEELRSSLLAENVDIRSQVVVSEDVAQSLHDLVREQDIEMVLMSAHGYSGATRWPYGGMALNFIAYGTTPLLIAQDVPTEQIAPTEAEIIAKEPSGH